MSFIDKLAVAKDAFTCYSKAKATMDEEYINLAALERVLYKKEYLRLTVVNPMGNCDPGSYKRKYFNELPADWNSDVDKDGNMVLWYGVEELYRELGGFAQ